MAAKHSITSGEARGPRWLTAAVAVLAVGAAACGGDEGATKEAQAKRPTQVATTPATPAPAVRPASDSATLPPEPVARVTREVTYREAEDVFRNGDYAEASDLFEAYTEQKPENVWGHYMHGLAAWKAGDRGTAERALERSVELEPDNVKALVNLGRVLLEDGRAEEAETHLQRAADVSPDSEDVWRVLGNVQAELGETDMAAESYRVALGLNGEDSWSMNNLGLVMIRLGRYEEALGPLARAVELKPGSPVFQNNLGVALERSGYLVAAAEAYRSAMAADNSYHKAATSLERVESLASQSRPDMADLTALARAFADEVTLWADSAVVAQSRDPGM
jgi:Flp pilus assembly protein TadD